MTDRELMQQALEALEQYTDVVTSVNDPNSWVTVADGGKPAREAITALRDRLAQPNEFEPDWDAMAVIVEEQQRMAKRIEELEAQPDAYGYASRLAVAIWEQHYKDVAPQWKPLDDLMGVLTQIDNMTSGLTRLAQPEQEPVCDKDPQGCWNVRCQLGKVCKHAAPRQWQGLTDEEINSLWDGHVVPVFGKNGINPIVFARAIEAKLRKRNA